MFFAGYDNLTFLATIGTHFIRPIPEPIVDKGLYTAPLNGTYEFYVQILSYNDAFNDWGFDVVMDEEVISYTRYSSTSRLPFEDSISSTVYVHLSVGQYVYVEPVNLGGKNGSEGYMMSWFSGRLISAD